MYKKHPHLSLLTEFPEIASEWNYEVNSKKPDEVYPHSDMYAWWTCPLGHNYRTRISNRTSINHTGCPYCAGTKALIGFNDLVTTFPAIAKEWNYKKNEDLTPQEVTQRCNKRIWWVCKRGHEWQTSINNRTTSGNQCPYCVGKIPIIGETDLATVAPLVAAQWHLNKNEKMKPTDVTAFSNKYVWWCCDYGHEWRTKIYHRTTGHGCPYCSGQKVIAGSNDLARINPILAAEWDYEANYPDTPSDVAAYSHHRHYWICRFGHSWEATVITRSNGCGCPICSGKKVISGINDLETVYPNIAKEWHPTWNGDLTPLQVAPHSNKNVWWICENGHEWKTKINNRSNGTGCPYCNQNRLIPEKTSLAIVNPVLASQWNEEKNNERTTWNTSAFCNDKVWWRCVEGHEWEATVSSRSNGKSCPYCSGRKPIKGKTDLATQMSHLLPQWNWEKNGDITPSTVAVYSNSKAWWICKQGHEWQATIASRSYGSGCPACLGLRRKKEKLV
ncbi:MAG: hypothetical protein K0S24_3985 [Sphingobacterium sp.]|jgi:glutaredoxin|nr:hypothetical protein [Sphingobacterium sp.]